MRKLASVQTIKSVTDIQHPTTGEETSLALLEFENIAWRCVAKRGEFAPGDKAVYIEISSIVPDHPVFEFLRSRKFKVKTIRLLGVLSQGLALPLDVIAEIMPIILEAIEVDLAEHFNDGDDVTDLVGVTRYEPEMDVRINGTGKVYPFPTDIVPKTDEIRIQSSPKFLEELSKVGSVVATLKIDGTSATYFWDVEHERMRVCSRNMEKSEDESVYWQVLKSTPKIEEFCRKNPKFVLQGEIAGPKIAKNPLGLAQPEFFAFNIWDREESDYVCFDYAQFLWEMHHIQYAPVVGIWGEFEETVESLLEFAKGNYEGTQNPREGIVLRPYTTEKFSYLLGGRLSCKVINNDYLLKGGE